MDRDENETPPADLQTIIAIAGVVSIVVFSSYQIGKLGVDWVRYGVRTRKEKKNQPEA